MDMSWFAILAVLTVVLAVGLRYVVYMMLVKFNRWLPEKAKKIANVTSCVAGGIALLAVVGRACLSGH